MKSFPSTSYLSKNKNLALISIGLELTLVDHKNMAKPLKKDICKISTTKYSTSRPSTRKLSTLDKCDLPLLRKFMLRQTEYSKIFLLIHRILERVKVLF
jgi:hypothetical protein